MDTAANQTPVWLESGEPANLAAAASDALVWLSEIDGFMGSGYTLSVSAWIVVDNLARLRACRAALSGFLPETSMDKGA